MFAQDTQANKTLNNLWALTPLYLETKLYALMCLVYPDLASSWRDECNQFVTHRLVYVTKTDTLNVFLTKTTTPLADFIRRNICRPTETYTTNRNPTPVPTMTIPYIKGTSKTISRILQPYNICVAHKPTTTLRHLLTKVKDKDEPNNGQGAVYKIKCSDCQAC